VSPGSAPLDRHSADDPLGAFMIGPCLMESGAPEGELSGLRFAVKDLFDVAGTLTGGGNPDWRSDQEPAVAHAPAVAALLAAGADLWGKTITDELAFSLAGANVHYGTPDNTAAPGHVPGGSSSGSASAVAGGVVDLALGTDTGGSVRVPASYCGIFGLRPTHGRIDDTGLVPLAPSFDVVGLFASDGPTLAAGWRALRAGAESPGGFGPARPIHRLVLARDLFALADEGCAGPLTSAAEELARALGLELVVDDLAHPGQLAEWQAAFRTLQMIEAWRSHGAWITARRPTFGPDVAERFAMAEATDPAQEGVVEEVRRRAGQRLEDLLGDDGFLVQPAATGPAPVVDADGDEIQSVRMRTLAVTAPAGLARAPVVSVPAIRIGGLPVNLAVVGRPGDDDTLVEMAEHTGGPDGVREWP
jgi:amidase